LSWERHLAPQAGPLPERIRAFWEWQTERWPRLADARRALGDVRTRTVRVAERDVRLQWNPARAVSSTAKVDPASIAARPCFLCPSSLPPEEHGLPWGDWIVLPNPAPILDPHLVVAHRDHTPQDVRRALRPLLDLAVESGMTALYNGPRCGASAPDHLHLQLVAAGALPDERGDGFVEGAGRVVLAVSGTVAEVERALLDAIELLPSDGQEPRLNLVATRAGDGVRALLFPRGAHRPACFFAEGPERRVVSPGVIDMAGTVVLVRAEDFDVLDGPAIERIYGEVTLPADARGAWEDALRRRWSDA
jgi:hypothetical protein